MEIPWSFWFFAWLARAVGAGAIASSKHQSFFGCFLPVLTGTPGLQSRLGAMNATFWNRAERCPIGRLDQEAAAALRRPLEDEGVGIDEDTAAHVARDSHGYPCFVQLWGEEV